MRKEYGNTRNFFYSLFVVIILVGALISIISLNHIVKAARTDVVTIPVGINPTGIIYNQINKNVYVSNTNSNTVSVINGHTNRVVATILVGIKPNGMTYSSDTGNVYVTDTLSNSVSVINGTTNRVVDTIKVGDFPFAAVYDSNNHYVYVCNYGSNDTTVINTLSRNISNSIVSTIKTEGIHPIAIASAHDIQGVYVVNRDSGNASVINDATNTVVDTIRVGLHPSGIIYAPDSGKLYVTNKDSNQVDVIKAATNRVVNKIPVGVNPLGISINPYTKMIYVANSKSNTISAINEESMKQVAFNLSDAPEQIAVDPLTNHLYITHPLNNSVSIITDNKTDGSNRYYIKLGGSEPGVNTIKLDSILISAGIFIIIAISIIIMLYVKKRSHRDVSQNL